MDAKDLPSSSPATASRREGLRGLARRSAPIAAAAGVFVVLSLSLGLAAHGRLREEASREEAAVLHEAAAIRARLESILNELMSLERGLVTFLAFNPDCDEATFTACARSIFGEDPLVRNMALLKGTVITYVYPREGNEAAIGRDLALVPGQREAVLRVRDTGATVVDGPVDLVQGGRGVVARMAISPGMSEGERRYWGQASLVIALDRLFEEARTFSRPGLAVAIGTAASEAAVFGGEPTIFEARPLLMEVHYPGGRWILAAMPSPGWMDAGPLYLLAFIVIFLIAGPMAWLAASFVATKARMRDMAYHDQLTGLPNRALLRDRLQVYLSLARRQGDKLALGVIDLDGFKEVNDRHGHAAGDAVLVEAARRLAGGLRQSDTAARVGGDEFVVASLIDPSRGSPGEIEQRLLSLFSSPFAVAGTEIRLGASVGISLWPDDGEGADELLALADERMYRRKRREGPSSAAGPG